MKVLHDPRPQVEIAADDFEAGFPAEVWVVESVGYGFDAPPAPEITDEYDREFSHYHGQSCNDFACPICDRTNS